MIHQGWNRDTSITVWTDLNWFGWYSRIQSSAQLQKIPWDLPPGLKSAILSPQSSVIRILCPQFFRPNIWQIWISQGFQHCINCKVSKLPFQCGLPMYDEDLPVRSANVHNMTKVFHCCPGLPVHTMTKVWPAKLKHILLWHKESKIHMQASSNLSGLQKR